MHDTRIVDLGGPVHLIDHGGDGPLLVLVHGLDGSALNWSAVGPALAERYRVIAPDLGGFGLTPPNGRGVSVEANARLVLDLVEREGSPATLIGNSMGGLVSMIAATAQPDAVERLVLVDPAIPVASWRRADAGVVAQLAAPLLPLIGAHLVRRYRSKRSPEQRAEESMALVAADPRSVPQIIWEGATTMNRMRAEMEWAIPSLVEADRSMAGYVLRRGKYRDLVHRVTTPTLIVHGSEDRLVSADSARWLAAERPEWTLEILEGVAHVPMMEVPARFLEIVEIWLRATEAARPDR